MRNYSTLRLGVNIDHVATIRNAREGDYPDPVRAARMAAAAGADGITAHLREDRRHIRDDDIRRIREEVDAPLNFEMAATDEMVAIALRHLPHAVCIVPEKREERTTEGGLDAIRGHNHLQPIIRKLADAGIRVSLFVEADPKQLDAAVALGAPVVELHAGAYADLDGAARDAELARIVVAAAHAEATGLECHVGHGLTYDNVAPIAEIATVRELNIGHFLIGEAVFSGLDFGRTPDAVADGYGARRIARRAQRMIIGLGTDLCDISRIEETLRRFAGRFEGRLYTEREQARAERRPFNRAGRYAQMFAAKEACSKALGTGFRKGVFWRDMEVVHLPSGKPTMSLTGGARARLDTLTPPGMQARVEVSLTDELGLANAVVIIFAVPDSAASLDTGRGGTP